MVFCPQMPLLYWPVHDPEKEFLKIEGKVYIPRSLRSGTLVHNHVTLRRTGAENELEKLKKIE